MQYADDMELAAIDAFLAIVQAGSFTRAADVLFLSQPAVSRRIEQLEQELGAALFARLPTGARLTPAGDAFLPHARQMRAALRDGVAAVQALEAGDSGSITLALVGTLASTALIVRLRQFRQAYPAVRLLLRTARSDEVSVLVQQGDAALGLRYFTDPATTLHSTFVEAEPLVVVCAASSPFAAFAPSDLRLEHLHGLPWVAFPIGAGSSGEPFTHLLERQLLRSGLSEHGAERIVIDSLTAQKRMVEAEFGLGLLPSSSVVEEVRLGSLCILPLPDLATNAPVYAIQRRNGRLDAAAQRLLHALTTPAGAASP